jgi:Family of unknown function (DUF6335)
MGKRKATRTRKPVRTRAKTRGKTAPKTARGKRRAAPARKARPLRKRTTATRRSRQGGEERGRTVPLLHDVVEQHETGPAASAGDMDADWQRAQSSGEEAAGGSVSTPDQDVVDEIGHALGVEQPSDAPLRSSEEILEDRDQRYWELDRRAQRKSARRHEP